MSSELKACQCGGTAEYGEVPFDKSIPPEYQPNYGGQYIACAECGMSTNLVFNTMGDDVREILREKWNRRTPSPAVLAMVETLKSLRRSHDINADDPWYSCPAATGDYACSNDNAAPGCNCGADDDNRRIDEALAAVEREIGGA